ncbi:hypothetical protein KL86CLO1_11216 [uncultured Eubacteriales bacterium]|uniref:Uncharacterized protein n=1 Tax=uncultured Eubacteriales bacterium TaxID=172733 RepID=A0A212JJC8_9FIRM|nr:hypothetical protein KL86CLO1_11216 [uncultured Eubacteriales bacterium]
MAGRMVSLGKSALAEGCLTLAKEPTDSVPGSPTKTCSGGENRPQREPGRAGLPST